MDEIAELEETCSFALDELSGSATLEDVASFTLEDDSFALEELRRTEELEDFAMLDDDFATLLEEFAALDELATLLEDNWACLTQRM